jgi:hypothetical protein
MRRRYRLLVGFVVALTVVAVHAQDVDILDAVLQNPRDTTVNGVPVRFGDPDLDAAELALHDLLPRPWTVGRLVPLFEAAAAQTGRAFESDADPRAYEESSALMRHLGSVLAASRDARAAAALGLVLEGERFPAMCPLAMALRSYFGTGAGYQPLPEPPGIRAFTNACPYEMDRARRWFQLNRRELERRTGALSPACPDCDRDAMVTVERLRPGLQATAPKLRLTILGGGQPRFVWFEGIIDLIGGGGGASRSMQRLDATTPEITIGIPGMLLGRHDVRMRALLISPGYQTVVIDVSGTTRRPVIPVTLTPLPSRTLTGTVAFADGAEARPFTLTVSLRVSAANDPFGIFAQSMSTIQDVAEAAVDETGRFTLVIPDVARDRMLAAPGNRFLLSARGTPFVLDPGEIDLDRRTDAALDLSASPRRPAPGRQ